MTPYSDAEGLTITSGYKSSGRDDRAPEVLALEALGWALTDEKRAERLLSLTGLTPEELRHGLEDRGVQAAVLEFLAGHEPDLVLAADALNVEPAAIIAAKEELSR